MDDQIRTFEFKALPIEIEVKDLSFVKKLPKLFGQSHKTMFYQIVWLTKGEALFNIDFREVLIKENELLIITPGQVCAFDIQAEYSGKLILFTNSFFNISELDSDFLHTSEILNPISLNKTVAICPKLMGNLIDLLNAELKQNNKKYQTEIAQSFIRIILLQSERLYSNAIGFSENTVTRRFYNAVEQHYKENKNTEFYVHLLTVTEKVLSKRVKATSGKTPKVYIDSRIILEAKRLLVYSNLNIKEIGYNLGFEEPSYFNKYFKKHTNTTPIEFRNRHQNK